MIIHSESQTVIDLRNFRVEINYSIRSDNNSTALFKIFLRLQTTARNSVNFSFCCKKGKMKNEKQNYKVTDIIR